MYYQDGDPLYDSSVNLLWFCSLEEEYQSHTRFAEVDQIRFHSLEFDTGSGNILSFLLPLFQEEQLSDTGENMCTKYWLTA